MNRHIGILSIIATLVYANQNLSQLPNASPSQKPEDMNIKIKKIAQGIVDKWVAEGLTVTKERVEGWLDILEKSQAKGKNQNPNRISQFKIEPVVEKSTDVNIAENMGEDFKQVRDTLVNTFTNIGQAKCENCKKPYKMKKDDIRINESPQNMREKDQYLENLNVEELIRKQEAIKQYMKIEKLSKLADVATSFSEVGKLKHIVNLAKTLNTLTTPREEL